MIPPTVDEVRALHEKYAPTREALDLVYTHCEIVCHIAEQLMARAGLRLDASLVRAGALLHDIGVYRLYSPTGRLDEADYIRHGVLGHEILRQEGFPESLCRFCSRHTGVGITRDDIRAQKLDLPPADYTADTTEERLVMYADKFHSKTSPPKFLTADSYAIHVRRFGGDKVDGFQLLRVRFGEPDLRSLQARYGHPLS
ncbi:MULTISPECIES: HD domain-containing protein [Streptomyces]|uniref:HD domain-containing protein n=3 Tax=Streptomyces TaxID=1883 RepID=A0ABD5JGM8_9ACTN|nr:MULTISPECIES: HD domain-containing protein [Streptomyces]MEE4587401.1 HD domain-containing protein [Streptomyces sp. DSM 41602]AJZ84477.1 HDIG domain-containing protein [Streptomyces sp. AgN23]KUL65829.1 phosphohydrolase [Streptomyces violaceusniger]RSS48743.1 HDIG domain-containing protein [Streptomyces sp. WAC05858]WTA79341.1 HDIG domain-containing protein [Streptomyces antimycoticus]